MQLGGSAVASGVCLPPAASPATGTARLQGRLRAAALVWKTRHNACSASAAAVACNIRTTTDDCISVMHLLLIVSYCLVGGEPERREKSKKTCLGFAVTAVISFWRYLPTSRGPMEARRNQNVGGPLVIDHVLIKKKCEGGCKYLRLRRVSSATVQTSMEGVEPK